MAIWLCLHWWYGAGWEWAIKRAISERLQWCNETFSVTGLLKTLFSPFKQTYNGGKGAPLDAKFHVFLDNTISRFVGFFARSFIILAGLVSMIFVLITGLIFVALWPLLPVSMIIALGMTIVGVGK